MWKNSEIHPNKTSQESTLTPFCKSTMDRGKVPTWQAFKAASCNHKCGYSSSTIFLGKITWVGKEAKPRGQQFTSPEAWEVRYKELRSENFIVDRKNLIVLHKVFKISGYSSGRVCCSTFTKLLNKNLLARQKEKHLFMSRAAMVSNRQLEQGQCCCWW